VPQNVRTLRTKCYNSVHIFTPGPIDSVIAKTIDDYRLKVNECIN